MKIKQTVTTKFHAAYCSWRGLEFTDENGDEVSIQMTDDNYLDFAKELKHKEERILKERAEQAAKLAEENADE